MSLQQAGEHAISWTVSVVGGAFLGVAYYGYTIISTVNDSTWDKLAAEVPGLVVMVILFSMFLRAIGKLADRIDNVGNVFGSKIDSLEESTSKLRETIGINAEAAKSNCKWQPPYKSYHQDDGE